MVDKQMALCYNKDIYAGLSMRVWGREKSEMEQIERIFGHDPVEIRRNDDREGLRANMVFLAENPEAFGMISDACPLATGSLLIAANGFEARDDHGAPVLEMPTEGAEGLINGLLSDLV